MTARGAREGLWLYQSNTSPNQVLTHAARGAREGLWLELTTYRHRFARAAPAPRAKREACLVDGRCASTILRILRSRCGARRCGAREAMTVAVGCKPTTCLVPPGFVGLQPTVIASRAPHLLLEQSVMTKIRRIVDVHRPSIRDVHFGPKFSIFWGRILLPCKFVKTELVLSFLKLTV